MSLDIDEIRSGRRRDWEQLQDPKARREKRRAEREAKRADKPRHYKDAHQRREERLRAEAEKERAKWMGTLRQLRWGIALALVAIAVMVGMKSLAERRYHTSVQTQLGELHLRVERKNLISSTKTPLEAWAAWRSGWIMREPEVLWQVLSPERRRSVSLAENLETFERTFDSALKAGSLDGSAHIAREFGFPTILHLPKGEPEEKELAVFLSEPVPPSSGSGAAQRWVAVFSWNAADRGWQLLELRPESQWRPTWTHQWDVAPLRVSVREEAKQ